MLVTFAALAGMYHLWWQRERVLYLGKSVKQQRKVVFQRAGLPPSLVDRIDSLARQWLPDARYEARGDATSLSYIKYLLLPRIPGKSAAHTLKVRGEEFAATGGNAGLQTWDAQPASTNNPAGLVLSFAVLLGWAGLIRRLWGRIPTWPESLALSCFFLTLLVLPMRFFFLSANTAFAGAVVVGLVGWVSIFFGYLRTRGKRRGGNGNLSLLFSGKQKGEQIIVGLLVTIILLAILWSLIMSVVVVPDDWDAWAIWGSKAKVLAQGTGPLHDVTRFAHPDYPLLWPVVWGFSGWLSGGWEECWSKGWGAVFLFFCVWEMIHAVKEQSSSLIAGLLAGALFLSIPNVPLIASWSYAEAPLWLMMTCGLACFLRWQNRGTRGDAVLAGLCAAAAAYTKNEGVLFAVLLGALFLLGRRGRLRPAALFGLTFILCYLLWWYWSRVYYDLGSHATAGLHIDAGILQGALARIPPACKAIFGMWKDIRQWNIVGFGIAAALIGSLFRFGREGRPVLYLLLPAGLLGGYLVIIFFHTEEIYRQIGGAWNRLTVQALPMLLVLLVPTYWQSFSRIIRKSNSQEELG